MGLLFSAWYDVTNVLFATSVDSTRVESAAMKSAGGGASGAETEVKGEDEVEEGSALGGWNEPSW